MNRKDTKTFASNRTNKRVIPKHHTKWLRKIACLLKVKWAKIILVENTPKRNYKHIEKCSLFPVNKGHNEMKGNDSNAEVIFSYWQCHGKIGTKAVWLFGIATG